jgi:amino acid adenylation domain-containing protein
MISDKPCPTNLEQQFFVFPASFAQQRLWFIEQLLPGNTLYVIPLVFRLTGVLQRSHLHRSIEAIVQRHEILRTTFDVIDGELVQVIAPELSVSLGFTDLRTQSVNSEDIALNQIWQEIQRSFHLNQGPLFRVHLWQLQDHQHLLLLALHHIIFDEWSSGVFIRELGTYYTAAMDGQEPALPDLPIQYADFAHWQRQWMQGEVLNTQLRYWKQQLQDVPSLNLPGARSGELLPSSVQGHQGNSQLLELPQSLLEALEGLSQQTGVTLFMTLLAAFQTLLHRYTGQTDIAIGSPIANRHYSQLEGLIGFLVNSLVLRSNLAGNPSFLELLERVKAVTLAAYDHQDIPFEKLVEELQPVRSLSQNPLFQVVFALQNTPMEHLTLPGLVLSPVKLETRTARFHLELYLWKCGDNFRNLWGEGWQQSDGLRGVIVYNSDLFDASMITDFCHHFQTLLEGIVANPNAPLSSLPLLTDEEQRSLLKQWVYTQSSYPDHLCIHQLFEAQVMQRPDAIAVQFHDQSYTYQQLNQGSNQLARHLQTLGIKPGMPVAICLERGVEAIAAMLAILKAGGFYVPLDPGYPPERLQWMLQDAGITVVLTQPEWRDALKTDFTQIICLAQVWDAIAQQSDENLPPVCRPDQLAYVIYTSGSTGTPKGVMVPHRAVNRLVCHTNYIQIQPGDRTAQVASLVFDAATFEVWGALLNGGQLVGIKREVSISPSDFVTELRQQKIDILFLTTALFNQTVVQIPDAFKPLKYLLFGGEIANVDRVRSVLQQGKPQHLIHVYGPTENTTFSTWYEVESIPERATTIPIGQAIAHTHVYILDTHLKPVPAGAIGEIYLAGDGLAQGYLNRPELTAEKFIIGNLIPFDSNQGELQNSKLYKTGDRALYRANGHLEFLGRTDHQIKIRGFRVELGEIEAAIAQHPAVQTVTVTVREVDGQDQLIAYAVFRADEMPTERDLRSFLKAKLPGYMIPAAFIGLGRLPLNPNGKVDLKALPAPDQVVVPPMGQRVAPTTSLEAALVELWTQLLGRSQVGIHDNFFELGGHSLLATQLVSRLRDRLQVELPLRKVFEAPTIAELAQTIAASSTNQISEQFSGKAVALPQGKAEGSGQREGGRPTNGATAVFPLSFAQQRLWFLYQLAPDNPFYNVPAAIRLIGTLDQTALERSFQEIVRRHAALRSRFTTLEGQPRQVVQAHMDFELAVINLQSVAADDRERISQQLASAEAQRPFNLTTDPLLRVTLLQSAPTESVLVLTMHHIVADGWSLGVLMRELAACYTAFVEGRSPNLPPLPLQYSDFAIRQRQELQGEILENQLTYWRKQLQDLPGLDLPDDRPHPATQTYRGATLPLHIPQPLTQALQSFSQQSGASLFMTLLAAFQTLLWRYTGQDDFAIGSPIANRHHSDLEGLIGFFVNSLVLRADLSGNPTFRELLQRVRTVALEAYEHQDLPFEKLVEGLDPDRDPSRNPLFQVAFALQNAPMQPLELPGLRLEPAHLESGSTRFDLEVHLWEPAHGLKTLWQSQEGLSGFISYSTDLFEHNRIHRLIGHFQTLLQSIIANPDARVAELPFLTAAEQHQILAVWHQTQTQPIADRGFHHIFAAQVHRAPDAIAVVSEQGSLTYADLNQRANELAQCLQKKGVQPNSLVGLCVDRSPEMVIGILGILKAGGAYVPLDPNYPSDRLHFMLTDTQVSLVLTQSRLVKMLSRSSAEVLCLDQVDWRRNGRYSDFQSAVNLLPDHLAYVIYTSGSTGTPKGVLLSHRGLCNIVAAQQQRFHLSRRSRILQFSSLSFDASIFEIALALGAGSTLYIPPPSAQMPGTELIQFLQNHAITHALLTPAVLAVLASADLRDLQVLITGGEACSQQVVDRWAGDRWFFNAYGPTETTIWATLSQLAPGDNPLTIGRPILNTQVYILDDHLQPVPVGIPGELYIGGIGLAQGYLNRPELTAERFIEVELPDVSSQSTHQTHKVKLYRTGDRGQYRDDGAIVFLGRVDHQIKIRGFRVELGEIEATLQRHLAIQNSVVTAVGATSNGLRLVAYFDLDRRYFQQAVLPSLQTQHIQHWQTLYNQTYQTPNQPQTFNITGWNSSYTGEPIPVAEMQEWVSDRVQQILALKPKRVLEVGCGTGLLLFQIAPHCEMYLGTDFSAVSLQSIQNQLDSMNLPQVKLIRRVATDFAGIEPASFDVVILNSIVQYFPSQSYLLQVLEKAIQAVTPGGTVWVGDVRSLPLLTAFHTWMKLNQADPGMTQKQLQQEIERSRFEEPELAIDPGFFYQLCDRFPQIQQVKVHLTRGRNQNEMTQFRYNVLLRIEPSLDAKSQTKAVPTIQIHDWQVNPLTVEALQQYLSETKPEVVLIRNVANSRVCAAVRVAHWLHRKEGPKTVGRIRETLPDLTEQAISPQDWWDLENLLPYTVEITWAMPLETGNYDVRFMRQDVEADIDLLMTQSIAPSTHLYTNEPLQANFARQLIPELRQHLQQTLPSYMIPATFVPLESLPLTVNGKVDRGALPSCEEESLETLHQVKPSSTPTEIALIKIWEELLRLKQVNIYSNFFELGGHSLLATQMTSRVRDAFGIELPLKSVFDSPTIAQLAPLINTLTNAALTSQIPSLVRLDRSIYSRPRSTPPSTSAISSPHLPTLPNLRAIENLKTPALNPRSPLVPLTLGGSGSPFFCVHPMFGVVFPYLELAHQLGSHRSFYGLQPSGLDGKSPPLNRMEAIAAYYIQAIRELQPQGPYYLGGWSFGGLVAFEMAQQLRQAGQEVKLLAILDTPAPCRNLPFVQSLKFLLGTALWSILPFLQDYSVLIRERLLFQKTSSTQQRRSPSVTKTAFQAIARLLPEESRSPLLDETAIHTLLTIAYAHSQAIYRYMPKPYPGTLTLFRANEQPDALKNAPSLNWSPLAGDIQLYPVPGNHLSLLKQPHIQTLAQQLRRCL